MEVFVTNRKDELLEFFMKYPTQEFHLRELSKMTKISFPWMRKLVDELSKDRFLLKIRKHNLVLVKANRDYALFRALKQSYNLFSLHKTGLVNELNEAYQKPGAIVLFGSYSRGEDTEKSDIDIAVITGRKVSPDLSAFESKLHRKIQIQEIPREKLEKEFTNTLANGIVLAGYLEL